MFSVCVLLYGSHADLARRVLLSLIQHANWKFIADVRIGLNACGEETCTTVDLLGGTIKKLCPLITYTPDRNVGKYPLMRRMFYDTANPVAENVMWFDDDSYLLGTNKYVFEVVSTYLSKNHISGGSTVVGARYTMGLMGNQHLGINAQPWCVTPVNRHHVFTFPQGAWWAARTSFLHEWNYPFPELHHTAGDRILGELLEQRGRHLVNYRQGIAINADDAGRESKAPRRGESGKIEALWADYRPGPPDLSHQKFDCEITRKA